MEDLNVLNMDYDERRKYDIAITIDAFDVVKAANQLTKNVNEDRIPYYLGMSGQVTPAQVANLLVQFLPAYLTAKVEELVGDDHLLYAIDQDHTASNKFDELLKTCANLAPALYFAETAPESDGDAWMIAREEYGPYDTEQQRQPLVTRFYPRLGTFDNEDDARVFAHRWNLAAAAATQSRKTINPDPIKAPWIATHIVDWFAAGDGNRHSWARAEFLLSWYAQEADKDSDRFYYSEGIQRLANVRFK